MNSYADKNKTQTGQQENRSQTPVERNGVQLEDNRSRSLAQLKKKTVLSAQQTIQKKENNTGLPDNLKSGIENLSGHSMDDVKVHYNSSQPAQLNAHAYAQGNQIHVAPGQEKHLAHEAWHVVQQKQGRVKPTKQLKSKVNLNDDAGLEYEADMMGEKALQMQANGETILQRKILSENGVVQRVGESLYAFASSVAGKTTGAIVGGLKGAYHGYWDNGIGGIKTGAVEGFKTGKEKGGNRQEMGKEALKTGGIGAVAGGLLGLAAGAVTGTAGGLLGAAGGLAGGAYAGFKTGGVTGAVLGGASGVVTGGAAGMAAGYAVPIVAGAVLGASAGSLIGSARGDEMGGERLKQENKQRAEDKPKPRISFVVDPESGGYGRMVRSEPREAAASASQQQAAFPTDSLSLHPLSSTPHISFAVDPESGGYGRMVKPGQASAPYTPALIARQSSLVRRPVAVARATSTLAPLPVSPFATPADMEYKLGPDKKEGDGHKQEEAHTHITYTAGHIELGGKNYEVGKKMVADLWADDPVKGSATGPNWTWMQNLRGRYPKANLVRGHLLNHDLGGFGVPDNLYPISTRANSEHSQKVEQEVKKLLKAELVRGKDEHLVHYEVTVERNGGDPVGDVIFNCHFYVYNEETHEHEHEKTIPIVSSFGHRGGFGGGKKENPLTGTAWHHGERKGEQNYRSVVNGRNITLIERDPSKKYEPNEPGVSRSGGGISKANFEGTFGVMVYNKYFSKWSGELTGGIIHEMGKRGSLALAIISFIFETDAYREKVADGTATRKNIMSMAVSVIEDQLEKIEEIKKHGGIAEDKDQLKKMEQKKKKYGRIAYDQIEQAKKDTEMAIQGIDKWEY